VKSTIAKEIAPGLPSLAASNDLRAKNAAAAGDELVDALKRMMGPGQQARPGALQPSHAIVA